MLLLGKQIRVEYSLWRKMAQSSDGCAHLSPVARLTNMD